MTERFDVALLTDGRYTAAVAEPDDWYLGNILADDHLLQTDLQKLGISSRRVDWADPSVDWSAFRCAVFRTTWDYFTRYDEFSRWFEKTRTQTAFCNVPSTISWNLDKHYLADLEHRGISVVPSRFLERGTRIDLQGLLLETGWSEAVIKPCISGGARHTYRISSANVAEIEPIVQELLTSEAMMLQPFMADILANGEDTLMVFDGRFSHAIRKIAKPGDFRVQDDHGGTAIPWLPTPEQIDFAERAMAVCDPVPTYGRVDVVRDSAGNLAIMELELIEPELWLRYHPPSADAFATAIDRFLKSL